jgi:pimeloyl-ACP methyl ester carboxylesterase
MIERRLRVMTIVLTCAGAIVALYGACCALLYFKQDDFLFFKVKNDSGLAALWQAKRITINTDDTSIEGWWSDNENSNSDLVVLYFGGNAEDVLYSAANIERLHIKRFLATNYRGYGNTPGRPSESNLFKDALAIYDYAVAQPGIEARNIVVMGRSLGSGVATYVAAHRKIRAAVLITPYDSIAAVAQEQFRFFPVNWLLKHRFPSAELAKTIQAPALMIAAEFDQVVPAIHTQRLVTAWAGPKQSITVDSVGHNDIDQSNRYHTGINTFLDSL